MDITKYLGKPESLKRWLEICKENPGKHYWLIYKDTSGEDDIALHTSMYPITGNTENLSDEEFLEFEASIVDSGFSNFLNLDQLEDIIFNLNHQNANYSEIELYNAVEYYFENDAFIELNN